MSESISPESSPPRSPRKRKGLLIASAVVGVLVILAGTKAYVFAKGMGGHHGWGGPMSAEFVADHIEHGVKYVLSDVDATAEQKAKVTEIMQAAVKDVQALRDQHLAGLTQIHEILAAESIDRARLESAREGELRLADQASRRILTGIADSAEVLTPQQRARLAEMMEQRHHAHEGAE
jgi:Spy/CpxP family protein refolding chaperone